MSGLVWARNVVSWNNTSQFMQIQKMEIISALWMYLRALNFFASWWHLVLLTHALRPIDMSSARSEIQNCKCSSNATVRFSVRLDVTSDAVTIWLAANHSWRSLVLLMHVLRVIGISSWRSEILTWKSSMNDTVVCYTRHDSTFDVLAIGHTANHTIVDMRLRECVSTHVGSARGKVCSW